VVWGNENAAIRADGCFTILLANAAAQIDDFAIETRMLLHRYDEPFERDRFVGVYRTLKPNPKFKASIAPRLEKCDAVSAKRCAVV
jgi:hypothetical protein